MRPRLLLLLFASFPVVVHAQIQPPAPIERQIASALPEAPQPAGMQVQVAGPQAQPAATQAQINANRRWERLARESHYLRPEVRIQAVGDPIRCDVDKVTPDEIFCTEHRLTTGPLGSLLFPRQSYHVPRREIRDVRVGGRELSTLLGVGIGIGVGVGLGSVNDASRADGAQAIFGLLLGGLGGLIGHALPLAGHPIYQQP